MAFKNFSLHALAVLACLCLAHGIAPIPGFRPPAVPLIVNSPYTSIWSFASNLTDVWPTHWSGQVMALAGALRIDGTVYRFMGPGPSGVDAPPMQQVSVVVRPTQTIYVFRAAGVQLTLTFTTPALPADQVSMARPYTYVQFAVAAVDGGQHKVQIYYDNTGEVAVSDPSESIVWQDVSSTLQNAVGMRIGTAAQNVLGQKGDAIKINWGYAYVVTPGSSSVSNTMAGSVKTRAAFVAGNPLPPVDTRQPRSANDDWPVLAFVWDLGIVTASAPGNALLVYAYDEILSMNFFGDTLQPWWRDEFSGSPSAMLNDALANAPNLINACQFFDQRLLARLSQDGGDQYATLASLGFRQTTGATTIVERDGQPWVFMKEISSDGDVSTVDVIYPASPFYLYHAPEMLRLMMLPLLAYGNNETSIPYNLAWAPHHLGTWPICDIRPDQQEQMPMEESGNFLVMLAAIAQLQGGNVNYLQPYMPLLRGWADYLIASLPDPGNQLCTDDFEGPSPHNVNLAAKGIVGLGAYAQLLNYSGDAQGAAKAMQQAQGFVQNWLSMASDGNHYRLQYDLPGTFSLKYNLLFQYILNLPLFPPSVMNQEQSYYLTKLNRYGVPLDNRATFTKTDWLSWIASMSTNSTATTLWNAIYGFANATPNRVPFTDWYDTISAGQKGFQARPVIGGLYAYSVLNG